MKPGITLMRLLLGWLVLALIVAGVRAQWPAQALLAASLWWGLGTLLVGIALIDALRRAPLRSLEANRFWPDSLPVGVATPVEITIHNNSAVALQLQLHEDAPASVDILGLPPRLTLAPHAVATLRYRIQPRLRGDIGCGALWLRVQSRWRLWEFTVRRGVPQQVKVYPDFAAISHFASLGLDAQVGAMGIHLQHRRGEGLDFHQLRAFREGDALRQIDWKSTARYQKPISREYQEERDQDVIFLLDCGRRMRTLDGELSHFDHALNAVLLTGYVALRQGDAVGLMTYAGSDRWLSPVKSQNSINRLITQLYDLHSSTATSDFLQAAQQLLNRHRKRSLVILVSDIRDEDSDDLRAACELLASRHLVVVASLREAVLDRHLQQPVTQFNAALDYAGTTLYRSERDERLQQLRRGGVMLIDCLPQRLHVDLVAQYLAMKRSGVI